MSLSTRRHHGGGSAGTGMTKNTKKGSAWATAQWDRVVANGHLLDFIQYFLELREIAEIHRSECFGLQKYVRATRKKWKIYKSIMKLLKKNNLKIVESLLAIAAFYLKRQNGVDYSVASSKALFCGLIREANLKILTLNNIRAIEFDYDDYIPIRKLGIGEDNSPALTLLYSLKIQRYVFVFVF